MSDDVKSYKYKKFKRDGSMEEVTAVVRQRSKPGKTTRDKHKPKRSRVDE